MRHLKRSRCQNSVSGETQGNNKVNYASTPRDLKNHRFEVSSLRWVLESETSNVKHVDLPGLISCMKQRPAAETPRIQGSGHFPAFLTVGVKKLLDPRDRLGSLIELSPPFQDLVEHVTVTPVNSSTSPHAQAPPAYSESPSVC